MMGRFATESPVLRMIIRIFLAGLVSWLFVTVANAQTVRVYLVAGQSNATGTGAQGQLAPPSHKIQTDVSFWYEEGHFDSVTDPSKRISSGGIVPLAFQANNGSGTFFYSFGFGPELAIGRAWADWHSDLVAVVKFAFNGTYLATDWDPQTGPLYPEWLIEIQSALTALTNQGLSPQIEAVFWMQGEWDARNVTFAAAYQSNLQSFIQRTRTDLGLPNLPFVLGRISTGILNFAGPQFFPGFTAVRAAQEAVAAADLLVTILDTDDVTFHADNLHFDAAGITRLGDRMVVSHAGLVHQGAPELKRPTPGVTGEDNLYAVLGVTPGNSVWFLAGLQPAALPIPGCGGVAVGIQNPAIFGPVTADADGNAYLKAPAPAALSGITLRLQGLDLFGCLVTSVVTYTFP
ncbi:MAG: sialate O-acetylesterase [Planctomycetota bacterium]